MSIIDDPLQPAFPRSYTADGHNGMTLRDYFAGQVASAALSQIYAVLNDSNSEVESVPRLVATFSYEFADAMLKARSTPTESLP